MEKLLVLLQETYDLSSDIHYNYAKSCNFFSIHKLMDEIREPIQDFMDEIKEIVYLGHDELVPSCKMISNMTEPHPAILDELSKVLVNTVQHIEFAKKDVDAGTGKVLDDISAHYLKYIGILSKIC